MKERKRKVGPKGSTKLHQFEPFSQKIARLKVDPVHRVQRYAVDLTGASSTSSYFQDALERWRDLNTSESFGVFAKHVTPLCNSLPQILHFEDQIVDLLLQYVAKKDVLSLEPLLDLLVQLGRDVGARFERHFQRIVAAVLALAAHHQSVEVIEWSFTCLAWLFKYLYKLLIADLRPTYDLTAPLLGREHQKAFVSRFTAEAMSFLIRKTASARSRKAEGLHLLVQHAFADLVSCRDSKNFTSYQQGLVSLFANAINGVTGGIHSSGYSILKTILDVVQAQDPHHFEIAEPVLLGTITSTIHQAALDGSHPVMQVIHDMAASSGSSLIPRMVKLAGKILVKSASVAEGTRVIEWTPLLDALVSFLKGIESDPKQLQADEMWLVFLASAVVLQRAPLDAVTTRLRSIIEPVMKSSNKSLVLQFCVTSAALGRERFQDFMFSYFARVVNEQCLNFEDQLCVVMPRLVELGCLRKPGPTMRAMACPLTWQTRIADSFEHLKSACDGAEASSEAQLRVACTAHAYIDILFCMEVDNKLRQCVRSCLLACIRSSRIQASNDDDPLAKFVVGRGLICYVGLARNAEEVDLSSWQLLCDLGARFVRLPAFLQGLLSYVQIMSRSTPLVDLLEDNLSSSSPSLRALSLRILGLLYRIDQHHDSELLLLATLIQDTSVTLETARIIAMQLRKLATSYPLAASDPWIEKAIPRFCCGLLHQASSQLIKEVSAAISVITGFKGEDIVADVAFSWLSPTPGTAATEPLANEASQKLPLPRSEDDPLVYLDSTVQQSIWSFHHASQIIQDRFSDESRNATLATSTARMSALELFQSIPQVAEKRSRRLVPIFLDCFARGNDASLGSEEKKLDESMRWSRKEKRAMLELFAKFTNPKSLYRSSEVYQVLLGLLANGDVDIQKPALEAVLSWNISSITPWKENLRNLLDDARFRDELTAFVQIFQDSSMLNLEDRRALVPLVIRLLYGRVIGSKKGSSNKGMEVRRKMILKTLADLPVEELRIFTNLSTAPFDGLEMLRDDENVESIVEEKMVASKQQTGFLKMIADMAKTLGPKLSPLIGDIIQPTVYCILKASSLLARVNSVDSAALPENVHPHHLKAVRKAGYKCLNSLFVGCPDFDWDPYMLLIFRYAVSPRLPKLPIETAQSPSGLLQLLRTWSRSIKLAVYFAEGDGGLLGQIAACAAVPSAKEAVKLVALQVIGNIVDLVMDTPPGSDGYQARLQSQVLQPQINAVVSAINAVLRGTLGVDLLDTATRLLSRLTPFLDNPRDLQDLLDICVFLLDQPLRRVNARIKVTIVDVVGRYLPLASVEEDTELQRRTFNSTSSLFGFFTDRASRQMLCHIMDELAKTMSGLDGAASLCHDLNSFSSQRLDEPDFERRSKAFETLQSDALRAIPVRLWPPILYNLLFYMRDAEEFALRANASHAIRCYVSLALLPADDHVTVVHHVTHIVLPAVRLGVQESSELVRTEYVAVMAVIARHFPALPDMKGMEVLLAGGDEEASFFNNILHIQQHRRLRALKRLAAEAQQGRLSSTGVHRYLLPLVEHFIHQDKDAESLHNLAAESVITMGALAEWLEWPQYRARVKKLIERFQDHSTSDKVIVRLLGVMADALGKALEEKERDKVVPDGSKDAASDVNSDNTLAAESPRATDAAGMIATPLSRTIPSRIMLVELLTTKKFLPGLTTFLREKDESSVSVRVPVAVVVVKLLKLFPPEQLSIQLHQVLTDVCYILRSRAAESRDMARKTLADVLTILGPSCLSFILKELRTILGKGYQVHVLSYTLHSLLVSGAAQLKTGDLDYCSQPIVDVVMDDIFGTVGEEKEAAEYISSMKEVRHSKSYDSMELLTKITSLTHLSTLIKPIEAILQQNLTLALVRKVEELLRRISAGISHNRAVQGEGLLVFCYELLKKSMLSTDAKLPNQGSRDVGEQRYLTVIKQQQRLKTPAGAVAYSFKLARFAMDVLQLTLRRQESLRTASYIAGFLPLINDAILTAQEEVRISAFRLLVVLIRISLPELDRNFGIYIAEAVQSVKTAATTSTDLAQASIKLVAAILQTKRDLNVDDGTLKAYLTTLLRRLEQDLHEHSRQGVVFNLLKAIMARKILIPEAYDTMDLVASIMVTNQARETRDLARGAYCQFLMEYPQGKIRFKKQLNFLLTNLAYQHPEGRQSVLEVVHFLLSKTGEKLIQNLLGTFMMPLVMALVNDESSQCREMCGMLLGEVFRRADEGKSRTFLSLLENWIAMDTNSLLVRAALQCYGFYLDSCSISRRSGLSTLLVRIQEMLVADRSGGEEEDWELVYSALHLLSRLSQKFPDLAYAASAGERWSAVTSCLSHPHPWIKLAAARLVGLRLADLAKTHAETGFQALPLVGSQGLPLGAKEMLHLTGRSMSALEVPSVSEELAQQSVKNVLFLARCLDANELAGSFTSAPPETIDDGTADKVLAIHRLVDRVCSVARREVGAPRKELLVPKAAALQLVAALCSQVSASVLRACLTGILSSLQHLTDASIPAPNSIDAAFNASYQALRSTSHEIVAMLQQKLGTTELVARHVEVTKAVREKREDRKQKRRIEALADPVLAERKKRKKEERKKTTRKEKSAEQRGRRRGW
ncbi:MAG: U3 snoRNP protein [Phylliscum demangeonii]|nr:MAG: U3 snoRNP protein [Phylliscum demangeonii]